MANWDADEESGGIFLPVMEVYTTLKTFTPFEYLCEKQ